MTFSLALLEGVGYEYGTRASYIYARQYFMPMRAEIYTWSFLRKTLPKVDVESRDSRHMEPETQRRIGWTRASSPWSKQGSREELRHHVRLGMSAER